MKTSSSKQEKCILLKNGIVIIDRRLEDKGFKVIHQEEPKYMYLDYDKMSDEFLIKINNNTWLSRSAYSDFYKELDSMRLSMIEANIYLRMS